MKKYTAPELKALAFAAEETIAKDSSRTNDVALDWNRTPTNG